MWISKGDINLLYKDFKNILLGLIELDYVTRLLLNITRILLLLEYY